MTYFITGPEVIKGMGYFIIAHGAIID